MMIIAMLQIAADSIWRAVIVTVPSPNQEALGAGSRPSSGTHAAGSFLNSHFLCTTTSEEKKDSYENSQLDSHRMKRVLSYSHNLVQLNEGHISSHDMIQLNCNFCLFNITWLA